MKIRFLSKKDFLALSLLITAIHTNILTAAASSSSYDARRALAPFAYAATSGSSTHEPQKEITHAQLQQRLVTLQECGINPFLVHRKPKLLTEIAWGFAQRTLQEYTYASLNKKYLLPKEPTKEVEGINGRFTLRYKIIGKLFQEYENGIYSFDDLFAIAWHQKSLSDLASFVFFTLNKEATQSTWRSNMESYPKALLPHLALSIEEFIAHQRAPLLIGRFSNDWLDISERNFAFLDGIEAIPNAESLVAIKADDNKLTALPGTIGLLKQLKNLYLCDNQLSALPDTIVNLTNLKSLVLDGNKFTCLPDSIFKLKHLDFFSFSRNELGELPDTIGELMHLTSLHLGNNRLTSLPNRLFDLTQLEILALNGNQFTHLPNSIGKLIKLRRLHLSNNHFASLPDEIGNLTQLEMLDLRNNLLTTTPAFLGNLINLEILDLHNNRLTTLPDTVRNLTRLKYIDLSNNNFSAIERARIEQTINQATANKCHIKWEHLHLYY